MRPLRLRIRTLMALVAVTALVAAAAAAAHKSRAVKGLSPLSPFDVPVGRATRAHDTPAKDMGPEYSLRRYQTDRERH